jgi:hypothetical protein
MARRSFFVVYCNEGGRKFLKLAKDLGSPSMPKKRRKKKEEESPSGIGPGYDNKAVNISDIVHMEKAGSTPSGHRERPELRRQRRKQQSDRTSSGN